MNNTVWIHFKVPVDHIGVGVGVNHRGDVLSPDFMTVIIRIDIVFRTIFVKYNKAVVAWIKEIIFQIFQIFVQIGEDLLSGRRFNNDFIIDIFD